jgi:hypothetical protein
LLGSLAVVALAGSAQAQWLTGWTYRRPLAIANPCAADLTDHQVNIRLDGGFDFTRAGVDGTDVRITAGDGVTLLDHWIDAWDPVAEVASIWLRLPALPSAGASVYLYYGNASAASAADGHATFAAYDGFENRETLNPGEWSRHPGNPVLEIGPPGSWDDHGATFASVIWDDAADEFRMYYHGFSGSVHQIGLATSADGLAWTKHPGNPIMTPTPGAWDASSVRVPMVWKEGATYHMMYTGLGGGGFQIGYANSADGITWYKYPGNPVFNDPTWASGETENWGVIKVGAQYLMWYCDFGQRRSGIAVSTDRLNWTPYQPDPIFDSSGIGSDDRYSQYCPFTFKYGDAYYVLVPSYDAGGNYSKFYLYSSPSPFFPASDRELVRIVHSVGEDGQWDDHDSDTPFVLTLDVQRTQLYNNQFWCYYAGEPGTDNWQMGLHLESDVAAALAPVEPLPGLAWTAGGAVSIVGDPVHQGAGSVLLRDETSGSTTLTGSIAARPRGAIGAWMRRTTTTEGDFDLYLYGGASLCCVAGLGREGDFHYWNGEFQPTAVAWDIDSWYLVTLAFDAGASSYDFSVRDDSLAEIVHVTDIGFGFAAAELDRAMLYTSMGYIGDAFADDFRVREWCGADAGFAIGPEEEDDVSAAPLPAAGRPVLHQNWPNPLNPSTEISYDLPAGGHVTLAVYDLQGRRVATLVDAPQAAGRQSVQWDGCDAAGRPVATGVYLYRLRTGPLSELKRLAVVR